MHLLRRCLVLLISYSCVLSVAADEPPSEATMRNWQREDVKVYREKFLALDRSFSTEARAAAEARLSKIENAANPLSPIEFAVELCRITALADNGHTQCMPPRFGRAVCARYAALITDNAPWCNLREPDFEVPEFGRVSIGFQPFGNDFHVVRVPSEHADLLGAKLVALDDKPIEKLRSQLRTFAGGTPAYRDLEAAGVLASPQQLHAVDLSKRDDSVEYSFKLRNGETTQHRFALTSTDKIDNWQAIPAAEQTPWSLQEPEKAFRYRDAPQIDSLVAQLRQILDTEAQTIAAFLEDAEKQRQALGRKNIVLDMRANGGGNLLLAREFMMEWPKRAPGRFYVLTSRETFSAAIASIAYLKQAGGDRVVIVGEPIGDRLMFFSDGLPVQLPHSGLFFLPAVIRMDYANGCREYTDCFEGIVEAGRPTATSLLKLPPALKRLPIAVGSLDPDVYAPWTIDSWINGADPAMEAVKEMEEARR